MKSRVTDRKANIAGALTLCARIARLSVCLLVCLLLFNSPVCAASRAPAPDIRIEGVVLDQRGAPVVGAQVYVSARGAILARATTNDEGRFVFEALSLPSFKLMVEASGFARFEQDLNAKENETSGLKIILLPPPIEEQVTITATRTQTRLAETAASVVSISASELSATAAQTIDDALRQVPGFQLFRRTGSRTANPTSQGLSLRGVGASGASRALVLADGLPLNDPFGGWVYWGRVPRQEVASLEILRGGFSNLYGSGALGGVVHLITRPPRSNTLSLEASYGTQQTVAASLFISGHKKGWGASLAAEDFSTAGYVTVDERERGPIDTPAASRYLSADFKLEREMTSGRLFLRASSYGESRQNGTPLQTNRTHLRSLSAGADFPSTRAGSLTARAYLISEIFDQNFTAVSADRSAETLTRVQRVPSQVIGLSFQWSRSVGPSHTLVAGLDAREVRGASDEIGFAGGRASSLSGSGGREQSTGIFIEDIMRVTPRLFITGGVRFDRWRNHRALSNTQALGASPGARLTTTFPDRTETATSPHLSLLYRAGASLSFNASAYRAFRAPTLNELYRSFRVGDVLTLASENLRAERLTGVEAGARFETLQRRLNVRAVFFWMQTTRPIANVTLSVTPALITRQRQNLGRTRSSGLEVEAEARLNNHWAITGGYLYADARVREFPANRQLEGLLIPQVARHQLTFQARYANPSLLTLGVQGRVTGAQYDDDQNRFRLEPYFTLDALISRRIGHGVEVFAAAENLFNQRYETGRTPIKTIGPPLMLRFGLRLRLGSQ